MLKNEPGADVNEIVAAIKAHEKRRPETFKSIGELLEGFKCKTK